MSTATDTFFVSPMNYDYDSCGCEGYYYNNQAYTDYPSPVSSPDFSEILENQTDIKSYNNKSSYYSDSFESCNSPRSFIENEDIDTETNLNNYSTSKRNYTTMNTDDTYTKQTINNIKYPRCNTPTSPVNSMSSKTSRKRSFDEVEDSDIFSNIDTMNEDDIDNYLNNIDLDLFPKVKSSSELLIFSPLAMKRFKLSNRSNQNNNIYPGESYNYNCFDSENDFNTPKIVELNDDEDISQYVTEDSIISNKSSNPLYSNSCQSPSVSSGADYFNFNSSPFMSYQQQQNFSNNHVSSLQV